MDAVDMESSIWQASRAGTAHARLGGAAVAVARHDGQDTCECGQGAAYEIAPEHFGESRLCRPCLESYLDIIVSGVTGDARGIV